MPAVALRLNEAKKFMNAMQPERMVIEERAGLRCITFRWHWLHSKWRLILVFAFSIGVIIGWKDRSSFGTALLVACLLGLPFLYTALIGWVNSTTFSFKDGRLQVRHYPLPWPGGVELCTNGVRQIEVEQHESQTQYGPHIKYRLLAKTLGGKAIRFAAVFDTDDKAAAEYVCDTLNNWLGISAK